MTTRDHLLSFGLFKSAILVMRKGSKPGWARLIVEVEDDEGVLSDWAIGGDLAVQFTEAGASAVSPDSAPMDYKLGIVSRNLFSSLHRGSIVIDIDSKGQYREGQIAYGLPRFALEDVQFDAEIASIDIQHRYLNALGFGGRGQGLWSRSLEGPGEIQYGAAMYVNKEPPLPYQASLNRWQAPNLPTTKKPASVVFFLGKGIWSAHHCSSPLCEPNIPYLNFSWRTPFQLLTTCTLPSVRRHWLWVSKAMPFEASPDWTCLSELQDRSSRSRRTR